jgi:predicted regulator of Ras-like GTPase activity (Roadblock/LC7/MglB family)
MDDELYSFALKNTLDEIRNLCPDITNAFMFKEDGEIIASDEITPQQSIVHVIDDFDSMLEKAETMGGIEQITIEGSKKRVNVSHMNNNYLVTITSQSADKNYVNTISRVLFTTVVKLLDKISHASLKNNPTEPEPELETVIEKNEETDEQNGNEPETEEAESSEQPSNEPEIEEAEPAEPSTKPEAACAETIGGIEQITIEGSKKKVNVYHMNNNYLVTITSQSADKNVNTISRVLFTTVAKLLDKISPASLKNNPTEPEPELETVIEKDAETDEENGNEPEIEEAEPSEQPSNESDIEEAEQAEPSTKPEAACAETMANQFMVEDLQGLLVKADTVRVDEATLQQWQQLCDDQRIEEVEIETFTGQSMRVKIKPIKDQRQEGKGIVQMPLRIQQMLEIRKGELVKLKPIIG